MKKYFCVLMIMFLCLLPSFSHAQLHTFLGVNRALKDVQNSKGSVEKKPFSPTLALGYNIDFFGTGFDFSPQLGYIHTTQTAKDSYGDQKIHSFFLNWDFLYRTSILPNLGLRFGLGNFIKRTHGKGGTVTIPNGSGTASARRPGGTISSYSSTLNFGLDFNFDFSYQDWFSNLGIRFETFIFRPISKDSRHYTFNLGLVAYF